MSEYSSLAPKDISAIKAVLFDLDGTLYDQKKMRLYMALELLRYYVANLNKISEIRIIQIFRKEREKEAEGHHWMAGDQSTPYVPLRIRQYEWVARKLGISSGKVRAITDFWINEAPLKHLKKCTYPNARHIFGALRKKGIKFAIASDYPVERKMDAMGLCADAYACATDPVIDALKPNPAVFLKAAERLSVQADECLVIGDRDERDGEGAKRAGMSYLRGLDACEMFLKMSSN